MLIDFKDEDFENKIKSEDVSVIQFSAAWCGPCKSLKPIMDKLAVEYKDKAGFYYADIEDGGINTGSAAGISCLLYTSPSPRDLYRSRMPSSA